MYVIQHTPSKTYFPIGERGRQRDAIPMSVPFDGTPRIFLHEADAQNSMRWWKGRLTNVKGYKKSFWKELAILEIKLVPQRTVTYVGTRL